MTSAEYHSQVLNKRSKKIKSVLNKIEVKESVTKKIMDQKRNLNREISLLHCYGSRLLKPQRMMKEIMELLDESYSTICRMRGVQTDAKNKLLTLV